MREMNWTGDFQAFVDRLNSEPQYFHPSAEALLASYRDITKRIDPELPRLFAQLPRMPYGVRAQPAFADPEAADTADGPSLDGSRPGWFNANAAAFRTRPKWRQEALAAHEAVPGHLLQLGRAAELENLPRFRRSAFYVAFSEGWALYAETLGRDVGLYRSPESRFGFLQMQIWRAARLVVDTGIHAFGWTRARAIDYLLEQTGLPRATAASEIDRYLAWPGQALGYMIGELEIIALREQAKVALGAKFDLRAFHNIVIDQGAVPLTVLRRVVDDWIAAQSR